MDSTERQAIEVALSTLQVTGVKSASVKSKDHVPDLDDNYQFLELRPTVNQNNVQQYSAVFKSSRDKSPVEISILGGHAASQSGTTRGDNIKWQRPFIETPYFSLFISTVLQDHAIDTDVCLVRSKFTKELFCAALMFDVDRWQRQRKNSVDRWIRKEIELQHIYDSIVQRHVRTWFATTKIDQSERRHRLDWLANSSSRENGNFLF